MIVTVAATVAALAVFGIFLCMMAIAIMGGQRENRAEMRRLASEFEHINETLSRRQG